MKRVELARVQPQPWRNGGGVTRELLAWPADGPWALRLSIADIERDGPFSTYDGVDRVFAVLAGGGVQLEWPGRSLRLAVDSAPLAFDGGEAPRATLLAGATRDLNLMLRRDLARGDLRRATPDIAWTSAAPWRGLLTLGEARLVVDDGAGWPLPAWSLVYSAEASGQHWRLDAAASTTAYWIEATPR